MKDYKKDNKATHFLIASIILHLIALSILFTFLYDTDTPSRFLKKTAPVILKQRPKPLPPKPKPKPKSKPTPRPQRPAFQGLQGRPSLQKKPAPPKPEKKKVTQKTKEPEKKEIKPQVKKEVIKKVDKKAKTAIAKKPESKPPAPKRIPKPEPKPMQQPKQKKLTLSQLSQGFLKFSQKQGRNLVQYTQSAKGIPTEEQLKHERYVSKVLSCIQTTLKIKRNSVVFLQPIQPSQTLIVDINLLLQKNGRLFGLNILKSSGKFEFDQFMRHAIADASNSFPPVPDYLSKDKYLIPIRFFVPAGAVMR